MEKKVDLISKDNNETNNTLLGIEKTLRYLLKNRNYKFVTQL